jgi:hypothetical protein
MNLNHLSLIGGEVCKARMAVSLTGELMPLFLTHLMSALFTTVDRTSTAAVGKLRGQTTEKPR